MQAVIAKAISEKELQRNVIQLARAFGWECWWTWNSLHSPHGWPDLTLVRPLAGEWQGHARMIFAELKSEKGKLTVAQEKTLELLKATGHGCYVWRPSQWVNGEIGEILR